MKYILSIPFALLFVNIISAQVEFAPLGAEWVVNTSVDFDVTPEPNYLDNFYVIQSEYDTTSNGIELRRVGDYLFHQDGNKVYYMYNDTLRLIYDFGAEVGDTITFDLLGAIESQVAKASYVVDNIELVAFDTFNLKKFSLSLVGLGAISEYVYIERMGSTRVLVEDMLEVFPAGGYHLAKTRCYIENGQAYQTEWYQRFDLNNCRATTSADELDISEQVVLYPNPFSERITLKSSVPLDHVKVHSAQGLHITTLPINDSGIDIDLSGFSQGVYFVSLFSKNGVGVGRKRIVKR